MSRVSLVAPLSRKITLEDISRLTLSPTHMRVMSAIFEIYDQNSNDGLEIPKSELADKLKLSLSTISRAIRAAAQEGYILIFDTYIKGTGQGPSRYFLTEGILNRVYAEHLKSVLYVRVSQLKYTKAEKFDWRPTLIINAETRKIEMEHEPESIDKPWPVNGHYRNIRQTSRDKAQTCNDLIRYLMKRQSLQEGQIYIRHYNTFETERSRLGLTFEEIRSRIDCVVNNEGLLATTLYTMPLLSKSCQELEQEAKKLKTKCRADWGRMILPEIPENLQRRVPIIAYSMAC